MAIVKDLGTASAYGYAKDGGYTGTEEEFATLMASYADVAETAIEARDDAIAAKNDAVTAKNDAQASATSAANNASTATTKATEASASAAAASQSATNAEASATAASGSASTASAKATEASESATTASGKATEAANSATAAQTAQTGAEAAQAAAEAAAESVEESAEQIAQNTADIEKLVKSKAPIIVDTATGAIASFPDGADGLPLKSLVASIEPVQDLHGQDAPYPPGGGKNKADPSTFTKPPSIVYTNGVYQFNPIESVAQILTIPFTDPSYVGQAVTVSFTSRATGNASITFDGQPDSIYRSGTGFSDKTITLNTTEERHYYTGTILEGTTSFRIFRISASTGAITETAYIKDIQIELGSTATTYAPYSNECPISGWAGLEGQRTGVNVCEEVWEDGYISASGGLYSYADAIRSKNFNKCKPGTSYCYKHISTMNGCTICWYDVNKNFIARVSSDSGSGTVTSPDNAYYFKLSLYNYKSQDAQTYQNDISINYPSTDTDYHAYSGESLSVSWQDTAGTVYGGNITINEDGSGELAVTDTGFTLNGSENWYQSQISPSSAARGLLRLYTYIEGLGASNSPTIANQLESITTATWNVQKQGSLRSEIANRYEVSVFSSNYADINAWKQHLTEHPLQVVAKLATSQIYHFDNLTQLTTVLGTNNIWVDTGDTSAEYRADTKLYIDKKLAALVAALS